jgi:hypothetical protein
VEPGRAGQREWRPRRNDVEPALRIEQVSEAEQVRRVGSASMMKDE